VRRAYRDTQASFAVYGAHGAPYGESLNKSVPFLTQASFAVYGAHGAPYGESLYKSVPFLLRFMVRTAHPTVNH
jgi:hypothetical protein